MQKTLCPVDPGTKRRCPWRFQPACAGHLAAAAGYLYPVRPNHIRLIFRRMAADIVEDHVATAVITAAIALTVGVLNAAAMFG